MEDGLTTLEAAFYYTERGLEVFPLAHRSKVPAISMAAGGHGVHDSSSDPDQLHEWFADSNYNLAVAIPENTVVVDVDVQSSGKISLQRLFNEHGNEWTAEAPRQSTGNGGAHLWFFHDKGPLRYKRDDYPGIEIGRVGRYVVAAPSQHENGNVYRWTVELPGHISELMDRPGLPGWFVDLYAPAASEPGVHSDAEYDRLNELDVAAHRVTSWSKLLSAHGWICYRGTGDADGSAWRHPNSSNKYSATIRHGQFFCYSPNTAFTETTPEENHGYTLYRAMALLDHGGETREGFSRTSATLIDSGALESGHARDFEMLCAGKEPIVLNGGAPAVEKITFEVVDGEPQYIFPLVDWKELWALDLDDESSRWMLEPLIATGRGHALYAPAKTGKSLLMFEAAAALATGREFLAHRAGPPISILYLDYEMTLADVRERLEQFGYEPTDTLEHLHYSLAPSQPPLDSAQGGAALVAQAQMLGAQLVVVDTTARSTSGEEDKADTYIQWSRYTGNLLKRAGITWVRVDHAGKNLERGQRGSSGKNDDVDVVWQLTAQGGDELTARFQLRATHQRMGWVPVSVDLVLEAHDDSDLIHFRQPASMLEAIPPGTKSCMDTLDALGAPLDVSRRAAERLLRINGEGRKSGVVMAAIKARQRRSTPFLGLVHNGQNDGNQGAEPGIEVLRPEPDREPF